MRPSRGRAQYSEGRGRFTCIHLTTVILLMAMALLFSLFRSYQDTAGSLLALSQDIQVQQACPTAHDLCTASICGDSFPCPLVSQKSAAATTTTTTATSTTAATTCGVSECLADQLMSKTCTADYCRTNVFRGKGQGGVGIIQPKDIEQMCSHHAAFQVCDDLRAFTGLATREFDQRMERHGNFHFEGEHLFWNPTSATELAWYYTTSVDYLFANSMHTAFGPWFAGLTTEHEPILDYSGGVGNNVLKLASMGIKSQYFGIGQMEKSFAEYRFLKRGYLQSGMVEIKTPWNEASGWKFDPIVGGLPRDGSLGAILAIDVLEHIPNYHNVAEAIVDSLRVGGILVEQTPFAGTSENDKDQDLRVHVSDGGIPMEKALGSRMKSISNGRWEKISNDDAAP